MTPIVYVPVSRSELGQLRRAADEVQSWRGFATIQRLLDVFDYGPGDLEEAEFAATVFAGVDALVRHGERLVLAVQTDAFEPDPSPDADFGAVTVDAFSWSKVVSIFADDADGAAAAAELAGALAGSDDATEADGDPEETPLAGAWANDGVQSMIEAHDLLWFGPTEAGQFLD